jgi:hypothetical protein
MAFPVTRGIFKERSLKGLRMRWFVEERKK